MNPECNGKPEMRQKHSLNYLRQLKKEASEPKKEICEEDIQRNRDRLEENSLKQIYRKFRDVAAAAMNSITVLRPMTVARSSAVIAVSLTNCLFLILIIFPFRAFLEVLYTGTDIISGRGFYKPETQNPVYVMKNSIQFHWYTTCIKVATLYFGMKASLQKNTCQ